MASDPFGNDFFSYVLGPVGDTLRQFAQVALPTPSGINDYLPNLGIPGVTTSGGPNTLGSVSPSGYIAPLASAENINPTMARIWGAGAEQQKVDAANATKAAPIGPRPVGAAATPYAGGPAPNVQRFSAEIKQVAQESGVPANVLAAIVHIECPACDPSTVRNDTRAAGIAQVVGASTNPLDNLRASANLLKEKQRIFGIAPDDWKSTAAAYFGAYRPGVGITADRDATGTTGIQYADMFTRALGMYDPQLSFSLQTQPSNATAREAVRGESPYPPVANSVSAARPTQFDPGLTHDEQLAACGPAVIAGLTGMPVRNAVNLVSQMGVWSAATGMNGGASESMALTKAGVQNQYVQGVNLQQARQQVGNGQPVVFSMGYVNESRPGHYFLADAFDPKTNRWHVGTSGTDLKSGSDWMTLEDMSRMGPPESMILVQK